MLMLQDMTLNYDDGSGRYFSKIGVDNPIKPNKNHKLPHLIEVAITIQLVEAKKY